MPLVLADRVKETTTTTGTGTVTLLGAVTGYQSFSAVGDGNTTYYCIAGQTTAEWEVGIGTYTSAGTTLSRTTVLASSNSGSLVNFSAGTKDVFVTYPAGRSVYADGTVLTATNSSILPVASGGTGAATLTGYVYGNGTGAMTASTTIPNSATTATSANTASAIVARDASGNFSAGTITASLSGNATTATTATTASATTAAATFNNGGAGDASGTTFNGSTARTISYNTVGASPLAGSTSITTVGTIGTGTWQGSIINSTYGGTGVNNGGRTLTVNTNSGTLSFTNVSTTLTIANTGSISGTNTGDQTITLTGDVTGSGTGSFATTLANSGVTAGTYASPSSVVVDAKGRVTSITAGSSGGLTISDDTTTNATRYPTFTSATSGSISTENVSSTKLTFNPSTGTLSATVLTASSDETLKTNWRDLPDLIEGMAGVKNGEFDWLDGSGSDVGVSAQDLLKILSGAVKTGAEGKLSVNYGGAALVVCVQLCKRILALEAEVERLKKGAV